MDKDILDVLYEKEAMLIKKLRKGLRMRCEGRRVCTLLCNLDCSNSRSHQRAIGEQLANYLLENKATGM